MREDLDAWEWGLRYLPVAARRHEFAELLPFATVRDYDLDRPFCAWGLRGPDDRADARGHTPPRLTQPRVIMDRVPAQDGKEPVTDPTASPFYAPFQRTPASIPETERQRQRLSAAGGPRSSAMSLRRPFNQKYSPAAPASASGTRRAARSVGAGGAHRATNGNADGSGGRRRGEIKVIDKVGFDEQLKEFLKFLHTDAALPLDPQQPAGPARDGDGRSRCCRDASASCPRVPGCGNPGAVSNTAANVSGAPWLNSARQLLIEPLQAQAYSLRDPGVAIREDDAGRPA